MTTAIIIVLILLWLGIALWIRSLREGRTKPDSQWSEGLSRKERRAREKKAWLFLNSGPHIND